MIPALRPTAGLLTACCVAGLASAQAIIIEPAPQPAPPQDAPHSGAVLPGGGEPPATPAPPAPATSATPAPDISPVRLEVLNATVKVENPAGLSLDLIPNLEVTAGSKIGFRIATRKPGYLILLDIDASGRLTQIFPDTATATHGVRNVSNRVRPGRVLTIPQVGSPYAKFEFVAEPPAGIAMAVAVLSDRPVQVVDLPDAPPPAFAPAEALKYVRDQVRSLKLPGRDGNLEQPTWSIEGKFYLIK